MNYGAYYRTSLTMVWVGTCLTTPTYTFPFSPLTDASHSLIGRGNIMIRCTSRASMFNSYRGRPHLEIRVAGQR